ncbi:hypothetical protein QQ020_22325 [Fulvivirgaceae bacterium BMA12]|uniref:DUF4390 domain-containing protein n=1 Tax=Agaribacillus aureus TaxID=3051825 RepID=A0ABT8LEW0_9BACT|nr:hypothetical protein [Fulvivirgaceae bacterium BMA12]
MRTASSIFLLMLLCHVQSRAQSWVDEIPLIVSEGKVTVIFSNYFTDQKLFNHINYLRQQKFRLDSVPFDSTGQYSKAKKELNQFLRFTSQNINIIPIRNNSRRASFRKTLNYEEGGHMIVDPTEINMSLIDNLLEKNSKNSLNTWFDNNSQVLQLPGISAVVAMKLLVTFEENGDKIEVKWKYVSSYALNTVPQNMVRSGSNNQIIGLKKP